VRVPTSRQFQLRKGQEAQRIARTSSNCQVKLDLAEASQPLIKKGYFLNQ
jgi:hypothetical protein